MQAGDVITTARERYGTPQTSNRWTNDRMMTLLNNATKTVALEADFPEAAYPIPTVAAQREYMMIDCVKIVRAYLLVNGQFAQPLPGTDMPTLQGETLYVYDQSSGVINGGPQRSPQWMAEQPQSYPLTNSPQGQVPVPTAMPYFSVTASTQRGELYRRGGNIGVVPAPSVSGQILAVDHVPWQPMLSTSTNFLIYPLAYFNCLVCTVMWYMAESDRSAMGQGYKTNAISEYPNLRGWLENFLGNKPKRLTPVTKRTFTRYDTFDSWPGNNW